MPLLGLVVERATTPNAGRLADLALLDRAVERGYGALRVSQPAGDVLSLGRYHVAPAGGPDVTLQRRLSGGRVAASGAGFVALSLALPHRSALTSDDPLALAPEQVLNRAVRGLLGALEHAGLAAIYPGRDAITVGRRPIALLGFEIDARGATLIEMLLALARDQSLLPALLDRADPEGVVQAPMTLPDDVTSVGRELGRVPSLDEVVAWLRHGHSTRLGIHFVDEAGPMVAVAEDTFVDSRRRRDHLDRRGRSATMLGFLEIDCALASDGTLEEVRLAGDFIAPSGTISRLEEALRGCAPERPSLVAAIDRAFVTSRDFILGLRSPHAIADLLAQLFECR